MRSLPILVLSATFWAFAQPARDYPVKPVPFTSVHSNDVFWAPRIEVNRTVTIPFAFGKNEETGRIHNFERAAAALRGEALTDKKAPGYPFDDTDIYKVIEGASYSLSVHPDPQLDAYVDGLIAKIAATGATGFPVRMGSYGVAVNNHITRGGHDTGVCLDNTCWGNRYLNNVLDGGVGTGVNTGTRATSGGTLVEGNIIYHPGFFITSPPPPAGHNTFKPCVQNSGQSATVRRNICVNPLKRWIEFSAEARPPSAGALNNLVYNNTLYSSDGTGIVPLFMAATYDADPTYYAGDVIANNLFNRYQCDGVNHVYASEIYMATGLITHNAWYLDGAGNCNNVGSGNRVVYWNSNYSGENVQRTFAYEESTYPSNWIGNAALENVASSFVDPANMDFHLQAGSAMRNAGVRVTDSVWGFPSNSATPDLGAYGLVSTSGGGSVSSSTRVSSRTSR